MNMKAIIGVIVLAVSLAASEYWVQIFSLEQNATLKPEMTEQLKAGGYGHKVIDEDGHAKVLIGAYASEKEAKAVLPELRCRFASDAFVRTYKEIPHKRMNIVDANMTVVDMQGVKPVLKEDQNRTAETAPKEAQTSVEKEACQCTCTKKGLQNYRICEALNYYKNSPHHTFDATE